MTALAMTAAPSLITIGPDDASRTTPGFTTDALADEDVLLSDHPRARVDHRLLGLPPKWRLLEIVLDGSRVFLDDLPRKRQ